MLTFKVQAVKASQTVAKPLASHCMCIILLQPTGKKIKARASIRVTWYIFLLGPTIHTYDTACMASEACVGLHPATYNMATSTPDYTLVSCLSLVKPPDACGWATNLIILFDYSYSSNFIVSPLRIVADQQVEESRPLLID